MAYYNKVRTIVENYKRDTEGSLAIVWAIGLTVAIAAIGAGIDIARVSQVKSMSQSMTDQVALTASAYYSEHEQLPDNKNGFKHNELYSADETGYNFPESVIGGNDGVKFSANYDLVEGEVTVSAYGETQTALMAIFGKDKIPFKTESTAKFLNTALNNPASIALVLDNSGSMRWDDTPSESCEVLSQCKTPDGTAPRIEGLINSVNDFMDKLDSVVGPQTITGKRVLRTGMIPYDNAIIEANEVDMEWGVISKADVGDMTPAGATNSSLPIAQAWDWLNDETNEHTNETGEDNPLRYMIFMTDGQNSGTRTWIPQDGSGLWRGRQCSRRWCWYVFETGDDRPANTGGRSNWEEGIYPNNNDINSKNSCQAMKAQGVRVFTIGFALQPGIYFANDPNNPNLRYRSTDVLAHSATALLADCATSPQDFTLANDTTSLTEAFEKIGESIIEEVIRLSN